MMNKKLKAYVLGAMNALRADGYERSVGHFEKLGGISGRVIRAHNNEVEQTLKAIRARERKLYSR
jgi:hypothetical protein